jgi:hypothetical protein
MSLGKAREVFTRDFADMIQKGRSIKIAGRRFKSGHATTYTEPPSTRGTRSFNNSGRVHTGIATCAKSPSSQPVQRRSLSALARDAEPSHARVTVKPEGAGWQSAANVLPTALRTGTLPVRPCP